MENEIQNIESKTSAQAWRKRSRQGIELPLPSGFTCLARRPGMDTFLQSGLIPNSLLPIVKQALTSNKDVDLSAAFASAENEEAAIIDMLQMMNNIVVFCVVEPKVRPVPLNEEGNVIPIDSRQVNDDDDFVFVDEVDFEDKNFIFQWAQGGTADLERFRAEQAANVDLVQASAGMALQTKPTSSD